MAGGAPSFSRSLPKGWGFFSRSRMGSAFIHLSFRIRFSGEESAEETLLSHTCHSESALAVRNLLFKERTGMIAGVPQGLAAFARPGMRKTIHQLLSTTARHRIFRSRNPLFPPPSAMTSTEGNES